jgi:hypothetical protein
MIVGKPGYVVCHAAGKEETAHWGINPHFNFMGLWAI